MADHTPPTDEPTMEEILASIRKIISDDDQPGQEGGEEARPEDSQPDPADSAASQPVHKPESDPSYGNLEALVSSGLMRMEDQQLSSKPEEKPAEPVPEILDESLEDLLALKRSMAAASIEKQMEEQSDIIFREDGPPEAGEDQSSKPDAEEPEAAEDVLTLTQMVNEDGSITDILHNEESGGLGEEEMPTPAMTDEPAPEMVTLAATAPDEPLPPSYEGREALSGDEIIANDALELMMVRTLRPMLKFWIDENLRPIVDQMVREELRRRPTK